MLRHRSVMGDAQAQGCEKGMLRHRTVLPAQLGPLPDFREPMEGEEGVSSSHSWGT